MTKLYEMIERLEYYRELLEKEREHQRQKELVLLIGITKDDIIKEQQQIIRIQRSYKKAG